MKKLMTILIFALPMAAFAQQENEMPNHLGDATRNWLSLQESGSVSSDVPRPMPGEIADEVYDRYLKSFTYPIPETFKRQSISGGGGGSGGGSGGGGGSQ